MFENYGDTPYIKRGFQVDPKRLFYSDSNIALKKMISLVPGYGILEAGTVVAKITESTNRKDRYVPYAIQAPEAGLDFIGGAYLLVDPGATATLLSVTMQDSYKFAVGDHIAAVDNDAAPIDCGAIIAIDRDTYSHYATIQIAETDLSTVDGADGGMIFIQTQTTTPYTNAMAILAEGADTGVGENAAGAQAGIVLSNAMLYSGLIQNLDSGALTDLGAVEDGQHLILK
jgi:hypothetical protein